MLHRFAMQRKKSLNFKKDKWTIDHFNSFLDLANQALKSNNLQQKENFVTKPHCLVFYNHKFTPIKLVTKWIKK